MLIYKYVKPMFNKGGWFGVVVGVTNKNNVVGRTERRSI